MTKITSYLKWILGSLGMSIGGFLNVTLITISMVWLTIIPCIYDYGLSQLPNWLSKESYGRSYSILVFFSLLIFSWFLVRGFQRRGITTQSQDEKLLEEIKNVID